MKLVIDISEERYTDILRIADVQGFRRMPSLEQVIANGTPLEDIAGEIKNEIECDWKADYDGYRFGVSECLDIIDKYTKENSNADSD